MKTILFRSAALLAATVCAVACSRSSGLDFPENEGTTAGQHSVAWLKSRCKGESTLLTDEIVVRGRVVANDRYGEWSRALVIADATGGITVFADAASLSDRYPFGASVVLYCNGLRLHDYGGKVVVGSEPSDYGYGFGIPQESVASHLHREADEPAAPVPVVVTLGRITAEHIDTYVLVSGVHFCERGNWCDKDAETGRFVDTDRMIADDAGNRFVVRTRGGCLYAGEPLPEGKGSLCGVVDYFNGRFSLRVVNRGADFPN
ncbi:MAG: DUF5689 domain-containing protein [Alistipes senegalensis]|nr:DUF5689 domain-containing protein [Bacteroides cellulosilyticus]MCM1351733.1 DUF5689 domain-containing protein [Alistipes senegalensis]